MLSAYFDESGIHQGSRVYVVAGLLAPPRQWERFTIEWQRVLDSEDIPEFHMAEFSHRAGIFKGWTRERCDKLIKRLIPIILRRAAWRVWTAVVVEDFHRILQDADKYLYGLCATGCALRVRAVVLEVQPRLSVPFMFEHGAKTSGGVFKSFHDYLLRPGQGDYYKMGALSVGERRKFLPLQAADILAYEVYKDFTAQMEAEDGGPKRGMRRSFRELLVIRDGGGYLFTGERAALLMKGIAAWEDAGSPEPDWQVAGNSMPTMPPQRLGEIRLRRGKAGE